MSTEAQIKWIDWKDRQTELVDKADFFDFNQRSSTAEWTRLLSESVATPTSRKMLKKYLEELFAAWTKDFAGNDELRKKRANAISSILLSSIATGKLNDEIQTVLPILRELKKNTENLTPLAIAFAPFRESGDHLMRFYGMCYHYPLFVEGVFDESIRLLFLLMSAGKGRSISLKEINKKDLGDLKEGFKQLGLADFFFEGWRNRVRNSIAHARFRYDSEARRMHFIDIDLQGRRPDFNESFTMEEFSQLGMQLYDVYTIIQDVLFLTRITQLVLTPDVPDLGKYLLMPGIREGVKKGLLQDPNS